MKNMLIAMLIGLPLLTLSGITPADLNKKIQTGEKIILIDVRHTELYQNEHIPGAINIPVSICDQKIIPNAALIVIYDDGLSENTAADAAEKLRKNNKTQIEILEGGFASWKTFVGRTTKPTGAKSEEVQYITYDALKKIQSSDTVIVDMRQSSKEEKRSISGNAEQKTTTFTDLSKEFPKAKVVKSPFEAGVSKKSLSPAQYSPLFVLVDNGDGKAIEMARTLKANGIHRFVVLAGGEKILERQGKSGLQRSGSSFTVPAVINKNQK